MSASEPGSYVDWTLRLAPAAAAVANYCDHADHNELTERCWVTDAARTLRELACQIAAHEGQDLFACYAARLRQIEQRNPLWDPQELDGASLVERAGSWRGLQLTQAEHDRRYHPDVFGLSKIDQLQHYALHVAKLTGAVAERAANRGRPEDFLQARLPDLLLFGIKLSTVMGERLGEEPLPMTAEPLELAAR
jgi:hypothetical protein